VCDQKINETARRSARNKTENCQPEAEEVEHACIGWAHSTFKVKGVKYS